MYSDFGDFDNGFRHVMKITIGESNSGVGLNTTVCFSLDILAGDNTIPSFLLRSSMVKWSARGSFDEGCLQEVPTLAHSCACSIASSVESLLPSYFSEEGVLLQNVLWGLWSCLAFLKRGQNCGTCSGDCGPVWLF